MPRDPFFEDLQRTLERFSSQFDRDMPAFSELGTVNVDVSETDGEYEVIADLPGYDKDDIDVSVDDGVLRVSATRSESTEEASEDEDVTYHRRERSERSVVRDVRLPGPVEETAAEAAYQNGVLTVTLPKAGAGSGTRIDVE